MKRSIKALVEDLGNLPEIDTIMLGGSRATEQASEDSDYDLYVYTAKNIPPAKRKTVLQKHCRYLEFNNQFWETEDDGVLKDDTKINILYRNFSWIEKELAKVVFQHQASVGYTTCFWHNVITSRLLFDRTHKGASLQKKYAIDYPVPLKQNIIAKNYPILGSVQDSYVHQIKSALLRKDWVSMQHRTTAFLASYFDILFALNELLHSGEKRIIENLRQNATKLPLDFPGDVAAFIQASSGQNKDIIEHTTIILKKLTTLLDTHKLRSFVYGHSGA